MDYAGRIARGPIEGAGYDLVFIHHTEDTVLVTPDGDESLTRAPRGLTVAAE